MTDYKINLSNSEFEQIQKDLEKFKHHKPIKVCDVKRLTNYLYKLERFIADENYHEFEYTAECFVCAARDVAVKANTSCEREIFTLCTDSM